MGHPNLGEPLGSPGLKKEFGGVTGDISNSFFPGQNDAHPIQFFFPELQMGTKGVYFHPFSMILKPIYVVFREDSRSGIRIACFRQKRAKNSENCPRPSRDLPGPPGTFPDPPGPRVPGTPFPGSPGARGKETGWGGESGGQGSSP